MPQPNHAARWGNDPRQAAPGAAEEAARMDAVRRYDILDTPPNGAYDRVAAMAARLFKVPVATVTIVDEDRIWFKATHGLDGVSEISREPGLCGSAVLADDTLVIRDTLADPVACRNGLVTGPMGVRFYAAAPIVTHDGHRLGTVNILDVKPRSVTEDDTRTLADLAAIVLDELELRLAALNSLRAEQERRREQEEARARAEADKASVEAFAATLQRTLLPPALPAISGMELSCHYATASPRHVGGDFYDVFPLDGGRWAFFLGDVCGKGPEAAAVTSLTRYTLRAAALIDPDPDTVLHALNSALLLDPAVGTRYCTAIFGILTPRHPRVLHRHRRHRRPPPALPRTQPRRPPARRPGPPQRRHAHRRPPRGTLRLPHLHPRPRRGPAALHRRPDRSPRPGRHHDRRRRPGPLPDRPHPPGQRHRPHRGHRRTHRYPAPGRRRRRRPARPVHTRPRPCRRQRHPPPPTQPPPTGPQPKSRP